MSWVQVSSGPEPGPSVGAAVFFCLGQSMETAMSVCLWRHCQSSVVCVFVSESDGHSQLWFGCAQTGNVSCSERVQQFCDVSKGLSSLPPLPPRWGKDWRKASSKLGRDRCPACSPYRCCFLIGCSAALGGPLPVSALWLAEPGASLCVYMKPFCTVVLFEKLLALVCEMMSQRRRPSTSCGPLSSLLHDTSPPNGLRESHSNIWNCCSPAVIELTTAHSCWLTDKYHK